jgi:hypothetical protein
VETWHIIEAGKPSKNNQIWHNFQRFPNLFHFVFDGFLPQIMTSIFSVLHLGRAKLAWKQRTEWVYEATFRPLAF